MISESRLVQLSLFHMPNKDPILYNFQLFIFPYDIQTILLTLRKINLSTVYQLPA